MRRAGVSVRSGPRVRARLKSCAEGDETYASTRGTQAGWERRACACDARSGGAAHLGGADEGTCRNGVLSRLKSDSSAFASGANRSSTLTGRFDLRPRSQLEVNGKKRESSSCEKSVFAQKTRVHNGSREPRCAFASRRCGTRWRRAWAQGTSTRKRCSARYCARRDTRGACLSHGRAWHVSRRGLVTKHALTRHRRSPSPFPFPLPQG